MLVYIEFIGNIVIEVPEDKLSHLFESKEEVLEQIQKQCPHVQIEIDGRSTEGDIEIDQRANHSQVLRSIEGTIHRYNLEEKEWEKL